MVYVLWDRFLRHHPLNPAWQNRDRSSFLPATDALLYALLHLTGYGFSLEELKRFRQWGSKTPGHPEYNLTPGVECTTGQEDSTNSRLKDEEETEYCSNKSRSDYET